MSVAKVAKVVGFMWSADTLSFLLFTMVVLSVEKAAQVASLHGRLQVEEVVCGGTACYSYS